MNTELDKKLVEKYPLIFKDRYGDMKETAMCWGFECGDGWYDLIDGLCSNLQFNTDNNNKQYVIKNKVLRFLVPFLITIVTKIPGSYNLNRKKQINPLVIIRSFLISKVHKFRSNLKFDYIESGKYPQIVATQVKEKFGGLRFYTQRGSSEQHSVISFAESLSYRICETCGSMKNVGRTNGWIVTLCETCAKERDPDLLNWEKRE